MPRDDTPNNRSAAADVALEDPVIVARIGAPHGVRGDVLIASFTDPVDNLLDYEPRYLRLPATGRRAVEAWRPLRLDGLRPYNDRFLARVPGYDQREDVATLRGAEIAVERNSLPEPEPDAHYWRDLNGARVVNRAGEVLGTVAAMMETGSHTVLVVRDQDGERLIPFVEDYVDSVEPDAAEEAARARLLVRVDWQRAWDD
ncbi:MAG: ribosome maturation factor RimM [Pseudomonadota bacterium]